MMAALPLVLPLTAPLAHRGAALVLSDPVTAASRYAQYPAPPGFKWDFITITSRRVTAGNRPIVILKVV